MGSCGGPIGPSRSAQAGSVAGLVIGFSERPPVPGATGGIELVLQLSPLSRPMRGAPKLVKDHVAVSVSSRIGQDIDAAEHLVASVPGKFHVFGSHFDSLHVVCDVVRDGGADNGVKVTSPPQDPTSTPLLEHGERSPWANFLFSGDHAHNHSLHLIKDNFCSALTFWFLTTSRYHTLLLVLTSGLRPRCRSDRRDEQRPLPARFSWAVSG